jgi:hypothetical protein
VLDRKADEFLIEIVATQVIVAVTGEHLDDIAFQIHHRDVESAATEVIDQRLARAAVTAFVGQRGGGRLVDDAHHLQAGNFAGLARRLALRIGEIGGHGNHRLAHRLTQVCASAMSRSGAGSSPRFPAGCNPCRPSVPA